MIDTALELMMHLSVPCYAKIIFCGLFTSAVYVCLNACIRYKIAVRYFDDQVRGARLPFKFY